MSNPLPKTLETYGMHEVCARTGLSYETLKFYCNKGLIPEVGRNNRNHRIFDERHLQWIHGIQCLKQCGMSLEEIHEYFVLSAAGDATLGQRTAMLEAKEHELLLKQQELAAAIEYIATKKQFYADLAAGKISIPENSLRYQTADES